MDLIVYVKITCGSQCESTSESYSDSSCKTSSNLISKPNRKIISKTNHKSHKPNIKNIKDHYQPKIIDHLCTVCHMAVSLRKSIVICKCDSIYHKQCFTLVLKICPKCKC